MKDLFKDRCDIVRDLLPLYADGGSSKETKEQIAIHLITCKDCRDYLNEIKKDVGKSARSEVIPQSDRHFGEVMNRLRRRKIVRRSLVTAAIITSVAINTVLILNND